MSGMPANPLSFLLAGITWPAHRFAATRRVYDLSIPPSDVAPIIRGGIPLDPLFRRFGDGFAQSASPEVVARVWDRHFEVYVSGKYASGIGLSAAIEGTSTGSQVLTRVGWTGPTKWVMPALTVAAVTAGVTLAADIRGELSAGSGAWVTAAIIVMCVGGQVANLVSRDRRARRDDLPMVFKKLEAVLAPHRRTL